MKKKCILQLPEYDGSLTALTFSSDGTYLIFSTDRATYVWNFKEAKITCEVDYAWNAILYPLRENVVALSDGLGQPGGLSGLWDIQKCEKIQEYTHGVSYPAFSPNGELRAGILKDRILITDVTSGEILKEIEIQPNNYFKLLFSPDGRFLLLEDYGSLGAENNKDTFILWDVRQ